MNILIIGNGFDIVHGKKILFKEFVNSNKFQNGIKSHKFFFINDEYIKFCKTSKLWSRFEDYCLYICKNNKINDFSFVKKISNLFTKYWLEEKQYIFKKNPKKRNNIIQFLKQKKIDCILSFNYTPTPEIYGFEPFHFHSNTLRSDINNINKWKNKYLKIHDYVSKKTQTILGHDLNEKTKKEKIIMSWDSKIKFNPKKSIFNRILKIEKVNLYSIGFSFGSSDQDVIDFVNKLSKNEKAKIEIYSLTSKEASEIKCKIKGAKVISKDYSK